MFRADGQPTVLRLPAKFYGQKIQASIELICIVAFERGLPTSALTSLLDVITLPNRLDEANVARLIKHFYPAEAIPSEPVCKVVCNLGQGKEKPSVATQNHLLIWLTMVYEVLEDNSILAKLYGVLFNMLDLIGIRCVVR